MKRLRIAIDCDDVIVPTASLTIDHYNRMYGTHLTLANLYAKDLEMWNAPDEETAIKRFDDYLMSEEYQSCAPLQETIEAINTLAKHHELHMVTGRLDFLAEATNRMLAQYFPGVFKSVVLTNFHGKTPRSKADVCQDIAADLLIDDHVYHAEVVAACGIDVLLFGDYPWNQGKITLPHIRRVKGWTEVLQLLIPQS